MKKTLAIITISLIVLFMLAGCSEEKTIEEPTPETPSTAGSSGIPPIPSLPPIPPVDDKCEGEDCTTN